MQSGWPKETCTASNSAISNASSSCRNAGIEVIAIGFGSADHDFLRQIASADQSALFNTSSQLTQAFEQIAQVVLEGGSLRAMRKR